MINGASLVSECPPRLNMKPSKTYEIHRSEAVGFLTLYVLGMVFLTKKKKKKKEQKYMHENQKMFTQLMSSEI